MKALVTLKYNKLQFGSCCSYWSRINYNSKEFPGSLRTGYYLIIIFRDSENLFLKQAFCFHPCLFNRKTFSVSYFFWWLEYFLNFQPKFINRCFIPIFIFLALNLSLMINFAFLKCFCLFTLNCLCSYLHLPFCLNLNLFWLKRGNKNKPCLSFYQGFVDWNFYFYYVYFQWRILGSPFIFTYVLPVTD